MRKQLLVGFTSAALVLLAGTAGMAQSAYFQAVTNLNPAAYYPLQETVPPPINDVETNLGSLGIIANAVYSSVNAAKGFAPGATADGDTYVNFYTAQNSGSGRFLAVPQGNPGVSLPAGPFTVEAWVYPSSYGREGIVSQTGPINTGGLTGSSNTGGSAGWSLTENDVPSLNNSTVGWSFHVYNGNGSTGPAAGAEAAVLTAYPINQWYHIVGVFDGVNCQLYVNGTNINSFPSATSVVLQQPMTGAQALDTWDPLCIGCARGLNANDFNGGIDEVAIYTNALTQTQIQNHYSAAAGSGYYTTITSAHPYMYWRMDAPAYTAPDPSTYPTANNFGLVSVASAAYGTSFYGTASHPGVAGPQFSGMLDPNNGNSSYAAAINGMGGANGNSVNVNIGNGVSIADSVPIDIGFNSLLNPTTINTVGFSVSIWFKTNPSDNRFQNMCGHSDSGWRTAMDTTGKVHFKPGNNGTEFTSARVYNDGQWHHLVATTTSTAENLYVDGVLDSTTTTSATTETGSPQDIFIGGDPQYLNSGNGTYASAPSSGTAYAQRIFAGSVAHFAFFTNALTAAQVQTLYAAAGVPPAVLVQPTTGRVNPAPAFLFFGVVASGATNGLAYQWYFNASPSYSGATQLVNGSKYVLVNTSQVTVSNLVDSDSGYYFVVITNNYGSVTSALATLSVNDEPVITAQSPTNSFSLYQNQSERFSVTATSDLTNVPNLFYQWFTNGVAVGNATNATYITMPAQTAMAGTIYQCVVTNTAGTATNVSETLLSVLSSPAIPTSLASSQFGGSVLALNPTAYWPMHEVEPPLANRDMETNYGTLGQIANAYFGDWKVNSGAPSNSVVVHQSPGALAGDTDSSATFSASSGSYAVIPRTSPLTTIRPPFTLEAWVKPYNNSFGIILGVGDNTTNHGINGTDNAGGFDWLWAGSANTFSITMRSGPTSNAGASSQAVATTEPKTTVNYYPGQWYHLVTTYDGTNIAYYVNGVQDGLQNSSAAGFNPNNWQPLTIGGGRWTGGINNQFMGAIDELAVYTNLLSTGDITTHYNDGISGAAGVYKADVLADNPLLYYRMDSPPYTEPPVSTWPVLTNYGSVGIQGVYRPEAAPGAVAGPSASGIPVAGLSANTAMQGDGTSIFADAGFDPAFGPTGKTPFTVAAWIKANPADISDRNWQSPVGHSDSGWRLNMDSGNGRANFNAGPGGGSDIGNNTASPQVNDGNWHYMVGTFDGTNSTVYVDGKLGVTASTTTANITSANVDVFLGAYPSATVFGDTATATRNEANRMLAGNMCEAAFWNNLCLNSNQVSALYNAAGVPPLIVTQPVNATANQNAGFTNTVVAGGSTNGFAYQWYENGSPRSGQTGANLILSSVVAADASTDWYVVVTNNFGSVTSAVVSLTVNSVPSITQDLAATNLTLFAGGHATFAIAAVGAVPLHYQWYSNSVGIVNATNASYALTNAQPPNSTSTYYCVVTNTASHVQSLTATVAIVPVPSDLYAQTILAAQPFGFWPLNEPDNGSGNNGVIANDYWGGNNGIYTNITLGQPGFNPTVNPGATSAGFGQTAADSDVYGILTNVDFSATNGGSSSFSIEAWVMGYPQTGDSGLVSKGYGGGGEQFNLDCGSDTITTANPVAHSFRFFVRDASGATHSVVSDVNPTYGVWHHLVGVCDESNGVVSLYIDGSPVGTSAITPGSGILPTSRSMLIGARPSNSATNANDLQFEGFIQDVAVYNYALSASQVLSQFYAGDIPASVAVSPTNTVAGLFGSAIFSAVVIGTPFVGLQWYDGNTAAPIMGQTNATLILSGVQFNDSYYLEVTNAFGTNDSTPASLTVVSGPPQIQPYGTDVPPQIFVLSGGTIIIPVTAYGNEPLSYQWQVSDTNAVLWTNLSDTARITGSLSNVLTIASAKKSDGGSYRVVISNNYNGSSSLNSGVTAVTVGSQPIGFNGSGVSWTSEQSGTTFSSTEIVNGLLTLTDNGGSEARSFFFNFPQYIGAFLATFTYQAGGNRAADGMAFVLQNDPRGAAALGGGGGSLGVSGITPSVELELNLYAGNSDGIGCGIFTNGVVGVDTLGNSINVGSGDPIDFTLYYVQGSLALTMTDEINPNNTFSTNLNVGDLTKRLGGSTAYVGFTGATGGSTASQTITNFTFISLATEAIQINGTNALISWPAAISGYVLQANSDLTTTNWVNVTNLPSVVNQQNQVTLPAGSSKMFYRLNLQP